MKTTQDLKVGDVAYLTGANRNGAARRTVERVGRKYFCLARESNPFDRATGQERSNYTADIAHTEEQYAAIELHARHGRALEKLGMRFDYSVKADRIAAVYEACAAAGLFNDKSEVST